MAIFLPEKFRFPGFASRSNNAVWGRSPFPFADSLIAIFIGRKTDCIASGSQDLEPVRIEREMQGAAEKKDGSGGQLFHVKIKNLHDEGARKELTEIFRFKPHDGFLVIADLSEENSHREMSIAKIVLKNRGIPFECEN